MADLFRQHTIELPDGSILPGKIDHRREPGFCGLDRVDGLRVLDLAANDGYFSFWSEAHGASEVLAIDVEGYEGYDWGPQGPPPEISGLAQQDKSRAFWANHKLLDSKVNREKLSVYHLKPEIHGQFDLIFNYGLLYHLRHPLLALDTCRRVCRGAMIIESQMIPAPPGIFPIARSCINVTDWFYPTEACMVAWLKSAGFNPVLVQCQEAGTLERQRFIAYAGNADFIKDNRNFRSA